MAADNILLSFDIRHFVKAITLPEGMLFDFSLAWKLN